jgi:hypothetical protein
MRLELWERNLLRSDTLLGMAEVKGLLSELKNKWTPAAAKIGAFGSINFRLLFRRPVRGAWSCILVSFQQYSYFSFGFFATSG